MTRNEIESKIDELVSGLSELVSGLSEVKSLMAHVRAPESAADADMRTPCRHSQGAPMTREDLRDALDSIMRFRQDGPDALDIQDGQGGDWLDDLAWWEQPGTPAEISELVCEWRLDWEVDYEIACDEILDSRVAEYEAALAALDGEDEDEE